MSRPPRARRGSIARAARSMADRAARTAATAANCPPIMASSTSAGSQMSMSVKRGLGRSVVIDARPLGVTSKRAAAKLSSRAFIGNERQLWFLPRMAAAAAGVLAGLMPMTHRSFMAEEIAAAPEAVARQAGALEPGLACLVARLEQHPPQVVVTCARGSSAHAATFGKHLIERYLGLPVAAAAPNVASIYKLPMRLRDQLVLIISQSGRSDDLIAYALTAREAGALTVAVTNDPEA